MDSWFTAGTTGETASSQTRWAWARHASPFHFCTTFTTSSTSGGPSWLSLHSLLLDIGLTKPTGFLLLRSPLFFLRQKKSVERSKMSPLLVSSSCSEFRKFFPLLSLTVLGGRTSIAFATTALEKTGDRSSSDFPSLFLFLDLDLDLLI